MTKITLNDKLKENALEHSLDRMQYEYDRFRLSKEQRLSMILIGTLGELIFNNFLSNEKYNFDMEFQAGQFDNMDFKIKEKIFEVKTSGFSSNENPINLNLFYSNEQYISGINKGFNYCVQIYVDGYDRKTKLLDLSKCFNGYIAGFVEFEEIKKFPRPNNFPKFYGNDYVIPMHKLKPNLIELINSI